MPGSWLAGEPVIPGGKADDQSHRAAGEACVGHQRDGDAVPAAERGDRRRGIEESGRARRTSWTLVADHHHVAILEPFGCGGDRLDQRRLTVEDAGAAHEPSPGHPALDVGELDHGAAVRGEVAVKQPQATHWLERCGQRMNHLAVGRRRIETGDLLGECLTGAGAAVAVEQARSEELAHDHRQSALRLDAGH
jgi:hypothetical protein